MSLGFSAVGMGEVYNAGSQGSDDGLHDILMQSAGAMCILQGPQHVFTFANHAYRALVNNRELIGKPLLAALPEIRGQGFDTLLDQVFRTGKPFVGKEVSARLSHHAEGDSLITNFVYAPKRNKAGHVDGVVVSVVDVTEQVLARKAVEAAAAELRTSEERLRQLVQASGVGTWDLEIETQTVTADAPFRRLFGLPEDRPLTLPVCLQAVHPDDAARVSQIVLHAMSGRNGGRYIDEYRLRTSSEKSAVWVESRGQLRISKDGTPLRLHGTVQDVTERKVAEAELHQKAGFERQLIGIVSHDLRNPVGAILLGAAALLQGEDELSERQVKRVVRIQNAAERVHRMIRDLLDFTQARLAGGIHIGPREMDLRQTISDVLEDLEGSYWGRDVKVNFTGDCRGEWDPDRLAQVVQNLVTNALKYSFEGSTVKIELKGDDDAIALSVHNDGPVIPSDRLSNLFLPFERATTGVDQHGRSIGLGLYIVQQVIEAHGGDVTVESTAQTGTKFMVRMKRYR